MREGGSDRQMGRSRDGLGSLEMAHAMKWLVGLAILGTGDLEG